MKVGVLSLQGGFNCHVKVLSLLGVEPIEVRTPEALDGVDALVIPGGESTTISMLAEKSGLMESMKLYFSRGLPVLGTCAGMILLSKRIVDGKGDQHSFGAIDIDVCRNGYGRQIDSFERNIDVLGLDNPFPGVFIRAPIVDRIGDNVTVLAVADGRPVLCCQGSVMVAAFHPELTNDDRIHQMFLSSIFSGS